MIFSLAVAKPNFKCMGIAFSQLNRSTGWICDQQIELTVFFSSSAIPIGGGASTELGLVSCIANPLAQLPVNPGSTRHAFAGRCASDRGETMKTYTQFTREKTTRGAREIRGDQPGPAIGNWKFRRGGSAAPC